MSEPLRIMVIAGHPADMFDHCGGTLCHHIRRGDSVTCLSLTQGLRIHDEVIYDLFRKENNFSEEEKAAIIAERQRIKYAEVIKACNMFGIEDIRFMDYDDEVLTVNAEMVSKLAVIIRQVRPDIVITHWPYQGNMFSNHHAITGQLALAAITAAHGVNFTDGTPSWNVAQIVYMLSELDTASRSGTYCSGQVAYASYYVDVSDVVDLKVKALTAMGSQKYDVVGYAKKTTEMWNGNFGETVRLAYAEGFCFEAPEVGQYLPLSDHRKWLARGNERELLEAWSDMSAVNVEV